MVPSPVKVQMGMLTSVVMFYKSLHSVILHMRMWIRSGSAYFSNGRETMSAQPWCRGCQCGGGRVRLMGGRFARIKNLLNALPKEVTCGGYFSTQGVHTNQIRFWPSLMQSTAWQDGALLYEQFHSFPRDGIFSLFGVPFIVNIWHSVFLAKHSFVLMISNSNTP